MTPGNTPLVMGAVSLTSQVTYSASRSANIVVPVSVASPGNLQVTPFTPSIPRVSVSQVKRCR